MANEEHVSLLRQGFIVWNRWRETNPAIRPDLSGANLSGADLHEADLHGASLGGADLREANLGWANLGAANLGAASLSAANLSFAILIEADLREANLSWANLGAAVLGAADLGAANLSGANLGGADLSGANLSEALVGYTIFGNNDISTVKGLDTVKHEGPSTIGTDTIFLSKGKIPLVFLRGAGVPEILIEYLPSLVGTGIEFYSLFISYSTADEEFAERLHSDLQAKGVRCWFAPHDMRSGKKVHEQIYDAIRVYDRLLLILSPSSMQSSWVETEISNARRREVTEKKKVLFPIRLCPFETLRDWKCFDADTGKDSAREIREFFIPDFSKWKNHDSYQQAFDDLMKDLNKKVDGL